METNHISNLFSQHPVEEAFNRLTPEIPLLGGRRFTAVNYKDSFSYMSILDSSMPIFRKKSIPVDQKERILARLKLLDRQADEKLQKANWFTRILTYFRQWFTNSPSYTKHDAIRYLETLTAEHRDSDMKMAQAEQQAQQARIAAEAEQAKIKRDLAEKKLLQEKAAKEKLVQDFIDKPYDLPKISYPSDEATNQFNTIIEGVLEACKQCIANLRSSKESYYNKHGKNEERLISAISRLLQKYYDLNSTHTAIHEDAGDIERMTKVEETLKEVFRLAINELPVRLTTALFFHSLKDFSTYRIPTAKVWFNKNVDKEKNYFDHLLRQYHKIHDLFNSSVPAEKKQEVQNALDLEICAPQNKYPLTLFSTIYIFENELWKKNLETSRNSKFTFVHACDRISVDYFMPGYILKYIVKDKELIGKILDIQGRQELFKPDHERRFVHNSQLYLLSAYEVFDSQWNEEFFPNCSIITKGNDNKELIANIFLEEYQNLHKLV